MTIIKSKFAVVFKFGLLAGNATFGHDLTSHESAAFSRCSILPELAGGI